MSGTERIVLTGFMGAGKSTVGPLVAARLGWSFLDTDTVLEARHGMRIAEIFGLHGEPHFRALEEKLLESVLATPLVVVALGGGALESPATRGRLETYVPGTHIVFLETSLEVSLLRCDAERTVRPVLQNRALLEQRYAARLPFYRCAHQIIDTSSVSAEEASRMIVKATGHRVAAPPGTIDEGKP